MPKTSIFDTYAKNYNEAHDQALIGGLKHDQFRLQKLEWVSSFPGRSLLDFGCNSGELPYDLLKAGSSMMMVGVDEAQDSIALAKEAASGLQDPPQFFHHLDEMPADLKFDLITCFNVLHHVDPPARDGVLKGVAQRLAPGGKLLIWEHNRWNPVTRYIVKSCAFDVGVTLVRANWLKTALQAGGLKIDRLEYVNVLPPNYQKIAGFRQIENMLKGLPIGAQFRVVASLAR